MPFDPQHDKLLRIALSLPETTEDWPWGSIHCKVAGKIFVGWGRSSDGVMSIGLRTTPALQSMLVASDPRVSVAKYTGKYGGIDIRLDAKPDWAEVEHFIVESWRIVAPKRVVAAYDAARKGSAPGRAAANEPAAKKKASSEPAAKKKASSEPAAKKKASSEPAAKRPVATKPTTKKPASKKAK